MSTRVGTFSYRKDYALGPFRSIWYSALRWLIMSDAWLFVGYSMPEADFEFRHILKTAQLAREGPRVSVTVVLAKPEGNGQARGECEGASESQPAAERYRRFFGGALSSEVFQGGWERWCEEELDGWLRRIGEAGYQRRRMGESSS